MAALISCVQSVELACARMVLGHFRIKGCPFAFIWWGLSPIDFNNNNANAGNFNGLNGNSNNNNVNNGIGVRPYFLFRFSSSQSLGSWRCHVGATASNHCTLERQKNCSTRRNRNCPCCRFWQQKPRHSLTGSLAHFLEHRHRAAGQVNLETLTALFVAFCHIDIVFVDAVLSTEGRIIA